MSDFIFNIAKGRVVELHNRVLNNDPTNSAFVLMILKTAEADATLLDYDTFAAILAGANTEADFTNYARITVTDADLSAATTDDTNDRQDVDMPDQTWSSAGGASNNTTAKVIIGYDSDTTGGNDSNIVPVSAYDFVHTTNGGDLALIFNTAGYARAS